MKMKNIIHAAYECLWKFLDTFFFFLSSNVCHGIVPKEKTIKPWHKSNQNILSIAQELQRKEEFCVKIFLKRKN